MNRFAQIVLVILGLVMAIVIAPQAIFEASQQGELIAGWMLGALGLGSAVVGLLGLSR